MSTRSTLAYVKEGDTLIHVYSESHDGLVHMEVTHDVDFNAHHSYINVVIPGTLADDVVTALKRAEVSEPTPVT